MATKLIHSNQHKNISNQYKNNSKQHKNNSNQYKNNFEQHKIHLGHEKIIFVMEFQKILVKDESKHEPDIESRSVEWEY